MAYVRIVEWGRFVAERTIPINQELVDKFNTETRDYYPGWKDLSIEEFKDGANKKLKGEFDGYSLNSYVTDWLHDESYDYEREFADIDVDDRDMFVQE